MRLHRTLIAIAVSGLVYLGSANAAVSGYEFDYKFTGDGVAQAFNDGEKTYIQLRRGVKPDKVFTIAADGAKSQVNPNSTFPYIVLDGIHPKVEIVASSGATSVAAYDGKLSIIDHSASLPQVELPAKRALTFIANGGTTLGATITQEPSLPAASPLSELSLDEPSVAPSSAQQRMAIPFARGSVKLGPLGRQSVQMLANNIGDNILLISLQFDKGKNVNQARARGRALRSEFARYGVKNIKWLDGGEAQVGSNVLQMAVALESQQETDFAFDKTVKPTMVSALPQPVTVGSTSVALSELENNFRIQMDSMHTLLLRGVLSEKEFESARRRAQHSYEIEKGRLNVNVTPGPASKQNGDDAFDSTVRKAITSWTIDPEQPLLKANLENWASLAGYTLQWQLPADFRLKPGARLDGSLEDVVARLVDRIRSSDINVRATFDKDLKLVRIFSS